MTDVEQHARRIERIEEAMSGHTAQIATLQAEIPALRTALTDNTLAIREHAEILNQYTGAQKLVHWLATIGTAVGAWFIGKHAT